MIRKIRRRLLVEERLRSTRDALAAANERLVHLAQKDAYLSINGLGENKSALIPDR